MWAAAAVLVLDQIENAWNDQDPVGSVASRDVLALVLLDAVRNTYRGACSTLGTSNDEVLAFDQAAPGMKALRDRFEHFDEYLRGEGRAQRSKSRVQGIDLDGIPGLNITSSRGGGPGGHTIDVTVVEA